MADELDDPFMLSLGLDGLMPGGEWVRDALTDALGDGTADERADAVIRLGPWLEMAGEGMVDEDDAEALVVEVTGSLWRLVHDEGEPELVRRRALEALVRYPEPRLQAPVRMALSRGGAWRITGLFCAGFLAGFDGDVREALRSDSLDERLEAWGAVAQLMLNDQAGRAVSVASDDNAAREERLAAIRALESIDDDRGGAFDALDRLADDPDEEIALAAEEARDERAMWDDLMMRAGIAEA